MILVKSLNCTEERIGQIRSQRSQPSTLFGIHGSVDGGTAAAARLPLTVRSANGEKALGTNIEPAPQPGSAQRRAWPRLGVGAEDDADDPRDRVSGQLLVKGRKGACF